MAQERGNPGNANTQDINRHLEGLNFPADKDKIVSTIRDKNAPNDVVRKVEQLPSKNYQSKDELQRELGRVGGGTMGGSQNR